jgi:hypothetical protein
VEYGKYPQNAYSSITKHDKHTIFGGFIEPISGDIGFTTLNMTLNISQPVEWLSNGVFTTGARWHFPIAGFPAPSVASDSAVL